MKARLIEFREIAPEVRHFVFELPEVTEFSFQPGQFVSMSGVFDGRKITRAYSIASPPGGNRFDLCLNRVPGGAFSPHLFDLRPGDEVETKGPVGLFVPRNPFRDSIFVATGTGIAPFRSMAMTPRVVESGAKVTLLFGARYDYGLLYHNEWKELEQARPGFRYIPTITRPEVSWDGRTGWVQQHLEEALGGRSDVDVYICGLKAMVDAIREILKAKGFDKKQIIFEKYD